MKRLAQVLASCLGVLLAGCATREHVEARNVPPGEAVTAAPSQFVLQVLEPTGGKIQRPKDWFYSEDHRGSSYVWTFSRENSVEGPYTTGVRIQAIAGIKQGTGKLPKAFIEEFVAKKKQTADKVVKVCEPSEQGLFNRVCLETEEGPHRILYSLFWGNDGLDMAVVSIAGTSKELWDTYSATFDTMSSFELIDMKRFDK